ncbi:MAG: hypothetical protein V7K32_22340 [Nostoc sp.]|uniref:hypothetical protein n=1 Tax=Nostoc sp. TaxID=1180 RepID=UPI002FF89A82
MPNSSSSSPGCCGCLGIILFLLFIGSIIFGGASIAVKFGDYVFGFGSVVNSWQTSKNIDSNDLETKYQAAELAVKQFHSQLEQGKCKEIYEQANEAFKKASNYAEFLTFCHQLNIKIETIKSVQQLDYWWQLTNNDSEKYILIRYETKSSQSSIQETFVWLVKDSKPELMGYHVFPLATSMQAFPQTNSLDNGRIKSVTSFV